MAHRPSDYLPRHNETFNSIRDQLERETNALIQERNSIQVLKPSNTNFPSYRNADVSPKSRLGQDASVRRGSVPVDNAKKAEIKHRIKEIIELCRDQNVAVTRQLSGVLQTEKGVYGLLQQVDFEQQVRPSNEPVSVAPNPQHYTQHHTPIRGQSEQLAHPGKNLQKEIRTMINQNKHISLSEEALQLIDEIEKRSLAQIEKMREEKLVLISQLNEEIRRHNLEKNKNTELLHQLDYYRKNQGGGASQGRYENQLKARVAYLQNLLQGQRQSGEGIDFNVLYAQGQAIRQDTLRLLRLKEAKLGGDDEEKRRLREEVARLQRRVEQLESGRVGGKASYQVINQQYSPIAPSHRRKDSNRNSANEYQSLVMEMRKITSN